MAVLAAVDPANIPQTWLDSAELVTVSTDGTPLAMSPQSVDPDAPTQAEGEAAVGDAMNLIGQLASDADDGFVEALFETAPEEGTQAAEDLSELLATISSLNSDPTAEFYMPEVQIVPNGDIADTDLATVLPEGVLGAYVSETDSGIEGGVILLSDTLRVDGNTGELTMDGTDKVLTLADVAMEEMAEAVAVFAEGYIADNDLDLEIAGGDVGARVLKVSLDMELNDNDFLDDDDSGVEEATQTEVMVRLNFEEMTAKANATTQSVGSDEAQGGTFHAGGLDDTEAEFYVDFLIDAAGLTGQTSFSDADMMLMINGLTTEPTSTWKQVDDLAAIVAPYLIDRETPNAEIESNFSRAQLIALMKSGAIQLKTDANLNVYAAYIDVASMGVYTQPSGSNSYSLADLILNKYGTANGDGTFALGDKYFGNAMQEFYGLDLSSLSSQNPEGQTLKKAFIQYANTTEGAVVSSSNTWENITKTDLNDFMRNDYETGMGILIAKDDPMAADNAYDWSLTKFAGGAYDPNPITTTSYSAEDVKNPGHDMFLEDINTQGNPNAINGGNMQNWVDAMNEQAGNYAGAINDYNLALGAVTSDIAAISITGTAAEQMEQLGDAIEGITQGLKNVVAAAAVAGQYSSLTMDKNFNVEGDVDYEGTAAYSEKTYLTTEAQSAIENAGTLFANLGRDLAEQLGEKAKIVTENFADEYGAMYAEMEAKEIQNGMMIASMVLDMGYIAGSLSSLAKGVLARRKQKTAWDSFKMDIDGTTGGNITTGGLTAGQQKAMDLVKSKYTEQWNNLARQNYARIVGGEPTEDYLESASKMLKDQLTNDFRVIKQQALFTNGQAIIANMWDALWSTSLYLNYMSMGVYDIRTIISEWVTEIAIEENIDLDPAIVDFMEFDAQNLEGQGEFFDALSTTGYSDVVDAMEEGAYAAQEALNWTHADVGVLSTLGSLESTGGNKSTIAVASSVGQGAMEVYDQVEETLALRDLGFVVNRGGQRLEKLRWEGPGGVAEVPWDPDNYSEGATGQIEWLDEVIEENGFSWANDNGWLDVDDVVIGSDWDNSYKKDFVVSSPDGAENRNSWIQLGDITQGKGWGRNSMSSVDQWTDDLDSALADFDVRVAAQMEVDANASD